MLHPNAFLLTTGHHGASWRLPGSDPHASTDVRHYASLARIAGRAAFDSLFLSDGPVLYPDVGRRPSGYPEPLTLLTAIAPSTQPAAATSAMLVPYDGHAGWPVGKLVSRRGYPGRNRSIARFPAVQEPTRPMAGNGRLRTGGEAP